MDQRVGGILAELEAAGELETIIFWYTDHGGTLPRQNARSTIQASMSR